MDLDFGLPLRHHGLPPLFDPEEGHTVVEPLDSGSGWWAGAPSAVWDHEKAKFYLYYRLRRPRGVELDRGGECVIAESTDGINFNPIWRAEKTAFESDSVERAALFKGLDNVWRLYLSYVDPDHQMWRVDLMEADRPDRFEPASRHTVFDPVDLNIEGIKDPFVFTLGHEYHMLLSYAKRSGNLTRKQEGDLHATADAYNTGLTVSRTGLATSSDGRTFSWEGDIFSPGSSDWDGWCTRICSLVYLPPVFTAFYDGASDVSGNYEERTGLASGTDIRKLRSLSPAGPRLVSPHASGCLRYLDALQFTDRIHYYYEYAREDGSHETRVNIVTL